MRNKKSPLAGGRNNKRRLQNPRIVHPPPEKRNCDYYQARAGRRANGQYPNLITGRKL